MLRLDSDWIWDSWLTDDGDDYHLFFLKAPRSLVDAGLRHTRASVGHATSRDLTDWHYLGEAFGPSADGWDDLAIWTGSVTRDDDGRWRMFYTALNSSSGLVLKDQRIGMAVSDNLHTWERVGDGPVVTVDPRWYKTVDGHPDKSETWRDPFVFRDPGGDGWHMLITARAAGADPNDDGVVGHARSHDLETWELLAPLSTPGHGFGQLEVLQAREVDGQPLLVFTCHPQEMTDWRRATSGDYCTWVVPGPSLTGPWDLSAAQPFVEEPALFAAPLVRQRSGRWAFVGFRNTEPEGVYAFDITDPIEVRFADGRLEASAAHLEA